MSMQMLTLRLRLRHLPAALHGTLSDPILGYAPEEAQDIGLDTGRCLDNKHFTRPKQRRRQSRMHLEIPKGEGATNDAHAHPHVHVRLVIVGVFGVVCVWWRRRGSGTV